MKVQYFTGIVIGAFGFVRLKGGGEGAKNLLTPVRACKFPFNRSTRVLVLGLLSREVRGKIRF